MTTQYITAAVVRLLLPAALVCLLQSAPATAQTATIRYSPSTDDFCNPERGFYLSSGKKPGELDATALQKLRDVNTVKNPSANYAAGVTLLYRGYLLTEFVNGPLSAGFLEKLGADFNEVRKAGLKMIVRFAYTNSKQSGDCPGKSICPPYGDAPKTVVLQHIGQLKPVLTKNADVIAVVQQGFIGIWGENHYTDHFGDPSPNGPGFIPDSSWADRNEMLRALLGAIPETRMVQVRTPQFKQRYVYGPRAPVTAPPLTDGEAYTGIDKARIGFHNDCFLSSRSDYGTYADHGNSEGRGRSATEALRGYFKEDSRYTAVGGETCSDQFSPMNDCAPAGYAEEEMASMHYSYLNMGYNNQVNNDWQDQGCMPSIKRRLGYRLVLKQAVLPENAEHGGTIAIRLNLENQGYAAPFNPRPVQVLLRHNRNKKICRLTLATDIRKWYSGLVSVDEQLNIPAGIPPGTYEMLLALPDAYANLSDRPEYAIRLANTGIWEDLTGFNKLNHFITIK